jgi:cis-3-alkyl-4-acyloxetan-2-one decarboxylase
MKNEIQVNETLVYIEGSGNQTIVMIHGWPDTHEIWKKQIEFFKNQYRCVSFTLPGFAKGDNRKYTFEDIISTIDQILQAVSPNQKVILMVHDWGCVFGYEYAMRFSEKIEKAIGIDIGDAGSKEFIRELSLAAKLMVFAYQMLLALSYVLKLNRLHRFMAQALQARSNISKVHAGMGLPYAMKWLGVNGGMKKQLPMLPSFPFFFAYATQKPFMFHTKKWTDKILANPANKVQPFNCGHWVMIDKADEFNMAVKNWIEEN